MLLSLSLSTLSSCSGLRGIVQNQDKLISTYPGWTWLGSVKTSLDSTVVRHTPHRINEANLASFSSDSAAQKQINIIFNISFQTEGSFASLFDSGYLLDNNKQGEINIQTLLSIKESVGKVRTFWSSTPHIFWFLKKNMLIRCTAVHIYINLKISMEHCLVRISYDSCISMNSSEAKGRKRFNIMAVLFAHFISTIKLLLCGWEVSCESFVSFPGLAKVQRKKQDGLSRIGQARMFYFSQISWWIHFLFASF